MPNPVVTKLPHLQLRGVDSIEYAAAVAAAAKPQNNAAPESDSIPRSPCVAMTAVATIASTSPATSGLRGRRLASMQLAIMIMTILRLCMTVAVPAFVYPMAIT